MAERACLGVDLGSLGCRLAVIQNGAPLPLWLPRQFEETVADTAASEADPAGQALAWKEAMGRLGPFGIDFVRRLLHRGAATAQAALGEPPRPCVLCVPAAYSASQRQVLLRCALDSGLNEPVLVSDSLALTMARAELRPAGNFLVYQCGYLGLEVAVVSVLDRHFQVLSYRARETPSGRALDALLGELLLAEVFSPGAARTLTPQAARALRPAVAGIRDQFRDRPRVVVQIQTDGERRTGVVEREVWERRVRGLVAASAGEVSGALAEARIRPADLTEALIAGGPTVLPAFRDVLAALAPVPLVRLHDWAASFGAALLAYRLPAANAAATLEAGVPGDVLPLDSLATGTPVDPGEEEATAQVTIIFPAGLTASTAHLRPEAPSSSIPASPLPPAAPLLGRKLAMRAIQRAEGLLQTNRLQEAVSMSHQAYQDDDQSPDVLTAMLDIHRRAAQASGTPEGYAKALEWLLCANGHAPGNGEIRQAIADRHLLHARQMLAKNRAAEAIEAALRAFQLRPECPETERILAEARAASSV